METMKDPISFNRYLYSTWALIAIAVLLAAISRQAAAQHCEDHVHINPQELRKMEQLYAASGGPRGVTGNKLTVVVDGITFDSDYDNGSLGSMVSGGTDIFNGTLFVENGVLGTRSYWFRFTMTGVANRTITINLDHTQSPRPRIRVNGGDWRVMTSAEAPNLSQMVLSFGPGENVAELSFFDPYGYSETVTDITNIVNDSPWATMEVLGSSFEGRDLHMVTVTNTNVPDTGKFRVWVHSRAHAGEVTSTHTMVGFLKQITEDSIIGERLRRNCIFNIVPLVNVDGTERGLTRWDAQGIDPERQWCAPITHTEVLLLKGKVDEFMATPNQIRVMLNLHSTQGTWTDTFFFKHIQPSVTAAFETIQQNYIDAFDNATPLFDDLSAQMSQLNACLFIESYVWNNWGETVMAMTHEGHYGTRITDGEYLDGDDYEELGRAQAVALIEYFSLPELADFSDNIALNQNAGSDTGDDSLPKVATDNNGNWVAVWQSEENLAGAGIDRDIFVATSMDNGTTWTAPALLNTNATSDSGTDSTPNIATDGSGNWVAVWRSDDSLGGTIETDSDILVARSIDNGMSWTAPVELNDGASTDSVTDEFPTLATDGAGVWIAAWTSTNSLGGMIGTDFDILYSRSLDNGVTWSAPAALNSSAATDVGIDSIPRLATDGAGNWVAIWRSDDFTSGAGGDTDIFVATSNNNGVSWNAQAHLNSNATTDTGSDGNLGLHLATDQAGNWIAAWTSNDTLGGTIGIDVDILAATSDNNGTSWSTVAALNDNATTDTAEDRTPFIGTNGSGDWVALWASEDDLGGTIGSDQDILEARSIDNGGTWSSRMAANSTADSDVGDDSEPQLFTDDSGNWVAVWNSNDTFGATIGGDFDIIFSTSKTLPVELSEFSLH
jgi:hypothetical protein